MSGVCDLCESVACICPVPDQPTSEQPDHEHEALLEAILAVEHLLEHWPEHEDPGPGIRTGLARWRSLVPRDRLAGLGESQR